MFINFWYAAELSANVTTKPVKARMLGQNFVLFRDGAGKAHCLSNVCLHRCGSLADGWVTSGRVVCPYHGWEFNGAGQCERIPSLGPGQPPATARARIDSYPVQEKYGIVFAFLGDLVVAVEPWPENWPYLEGLPDNVVIEQVACSRNGRDTVTLAMNRDHIEAGHLTSAPASSNDWADRMGWGEHLADVTVPATTVDLLAARYGVPSLIKCDVEGHEVEVFEGVQATISERSDLYIEVHHASLGGILMDMLRPVYGRSIERIAHPFYKVGSWQFDHHYFLCTRPAG